MEIKFLNLFALLIAFYLVSFTETSKALKFTYNGFQSANLNLDGIAGITKSGLLMLTNNTIYRTGHAFHPDPITFKNSSNGSAFSFSTTFVCAIRSSLPNLSAHGLTFFISPTKDLPRGQSDELFGLFTNVTNGNSTEHIFAVELDTIQNTDTKDIDDNHVGFDINSPISIRSNPAGYYPDGGNGVFRNMSLLSGNPIRVWVDYDAESKLITTAIAPPEVGARPNTPLLSLTYDLSSVLQQSMYVGLSATTGPVLSNHYILGWSFASEGDVVQQLEISRLPKLPRIGPKKVPKFLSIGVPVICLSVILTVIFSITYYVRRKNMYAEVLEDWEVEYGPQRFRFRDLYRATKGFKDTGLLGAGGFGRVYKGVLPNCRLQIAVKRVSHQSRQGMRQFVAEIVSIGRMSHRNLVPLLGYCRRKNELLLVYEYMPNGSLDKYLHHPDQKFTLDWGQRFKVIKGVASGLFYLHQGWEQVVIHRDIKASNVLLDSELNGRVGDFGLAKLYDHGADPQTTHVVGTVGYLAPEHYTTGRATTSTDVYAFGAFLLEVVCGKRPVEPRPGLAEDLILVERVFSCWIEGRILSTVDENLGNDYVKDEAELVLKLGLMCSNSEPTARPSMQQVVLYLDGSMPLPELSSLGISASGIGFAHLNGFDDVGMFYSSSTGNASSQYTHPAESLLSGGR